MHISDLIKEIEKIAPLSGQADWDKSGMQVAREGDEITKMAVFLDPEPAMIRIASEKAQFLLSHHPLSLKPELPARHNNWYYSLRNLFAANACLYAAHTSLDVELDGPSGWLGRMLELRGLETLEPTGDNPSTGFGGIGDMPQAIPFSELIGMVLKLAKCKDAALCGPEPESEISRVAFCGGSGASLVEVAAAKGAQLFITGDIRHHAAIDAPIPVMDVGHHSLEEEMMRRFAMLLQERLKKVDVLFLPSTSPFRRICAGE